MRVTLAVVKGWENYKRLTLTKAVKLTSKAGKVVNLKPGDVIGIRPASSVKGALRVITEKTGPTFVFTHSPEQAAKLHAIMKPAKVGKSKPAASNKPSKLAPDSNVKQFWSFYKVYHKYRKKYPAVTSPYDLAAFQWAKEFSGVNHGTVKLYRASKLRDFKFAPNKQITLSHARGLASFTNKMSAAVEFGKHHQSGNSSYLLTANVQDERILCSPKVLQAIGRKLASSKVEELRDMSEELLDTARDLAKHEAEYFVIPTKLKCVVLKQIKK